MSGKYPFYGYVFVCISPGYAIVKNEYSFRGTFMSLAPVKRHGPADFLTVYVVMVLIEIQFNLKSTRRKKKRTMIS